MGKKFLLIILSLFIAGAAFFGIITLEKKLTNPSGTKKVYVLKKAVNKYQIFTKENFNEYFTLKETSNDSLISGYITDKNNILDTYAKEDLLKGEQISSIRIDNVKNKTKEIQNKVETSLKFSDISDVVGGTLKPGDMIDIVLTEADSNNKVITETTLHNVFISNVFTSDGTLINRDNNSKLSAMIFNIYLSDVDANKLDNALKRGTIKVHKILDSADDNNPNKIINDK